MEEFVLIKSGVNLNRVNLGIALISDLKVWEINKQKCRIKRLVIWVIQKSSGSIKICRYSIKIKSNTINLRGKSLSIIPTFTFFWKIAPRANKELTTTTNFKA